jgi:leucyl aminopeptidase
MQIKLISLPPDQIEAAALVLVAFEKENGAPPAWGGFANGWIADVYASGEFKGKLLDMALLHRPAGLKCEKLLLVGGGKASSFTLAELRKTAGAALRLLKPKGCPTVAMALEAGYSSPEHVAAAIEGALLGDHETDTYKTENRDDRTPVACFSLAIPAETPESQQAMERGRIVAESQNYARLLINEPGNRLTPAVLAERARQMAAEAGLHCEVLDREAMRQLGMGALLGVASGSAQPPVFIILRYRPERPAAGGAHLGLVGKGITFDSGGISIKPSENMEKMKYDMAGGAAVLGAIRALASLKPSIPVTAFVPAVENMPGGSAQRPGDIVTTLSGKTVEVLNTDAEGRLILADALTYAKRLGCTHLVDVATLTGAIAIALGNVNVGVFSNDDKLLAGLLAASRAAGERMWHMPLDEDYREMLKSAFADLPNVGTRYGGAITAAMFLKEFVEQTPWAHLDIAGTAWMEDAKPFMAKGPTGVTVPTLIALALGWRD